MSYLELFSCTNKTVLVTGGTGLIGREIVRALSEFGANVYAADIDLTKPKNMVGNNVKYLLLDITSVSSVKAVLSAIVKERKKVDVLINCAYPRTKDWEIKFENVPFDSWKKNLNSHLGGYFLCCQATAEHMKDKGGGSIINFASIFGIAAPDFSLYKKTEMTMPVAYAAIKGGIVALTRYLAAYYAKYRVRANVVSPGGVQDKQPPVFVKRYSAKTPLGRMAEPKDIVGAVIYLASNASSYVTGHNLLVDGGWTI